MKRRRVKKEEEANESTNAKVNRHDVDDYYDDHIIVAGPVKLRKARHDRFG